jgi:acyl dehydratase
VKAGERIEPLHVRPDEDVTFRYAEASGDHSSVHLDEEFARSVGLPGIILHGLYSMALVARARTRSLEEIRALCDPSRYRCTISRSLARRSR